MIVLVLWETKYINKTKKQNIIVINEGKTVEQLTKGQNRIMFLVTTLSFFGKFLKENSKYLNIYTSISLANSTIDGSLS